MRALRDVIILALFFGGIWAIFSYLPILPDKDYFTVSVETEKELGEAIIKHQLKKDPSFVFIENLEIDSSLAIITSRLLSEIDDPLFNYSFHIIESNQVNAFAIPGGHIFIYTGLIELVDDPEELAAVLAHELGHAEERHVIQRLVKQIGLIALTSGDGMILDQVVTMMGSTKFDRVQERRADEFGFELMENAGINPKHFGRIMLKMQEKYDAVPEYFEVISTHPNTERRIRNAMSYVTKKGFEEQPIDMDFEAFKERIQEWKKAH